jgi:hypothetical protein
MKVAVSIPDPTFAEAEALARRMKLSRSKLYAKALDAFVANSNAEDLTAIANEIADDIEDEDRVLIRKAAARNVLRNTEW